MTRSIEQDMGILWHLLFEIVADLEKRLSYHLEIHELTPPQFYVLKTLSEHGGRCRIGQIADEHHLTNATMTGLVKRLESMSPPLVERKRSEDDGRAVDVLLTKAGIARYEAVYEGMMAQLRTLLTILPDDERQQLVDKVQQYFRLLGQLFPIDASEEETVRS